MIRALPPGGEPLHLADILGALLGRKTEFEPRLRAGLGVRHCFLLSSGTAALVVALTGLRSLRPDRTEVIMPAYTCPNVLAAAVLAGLTPVLCDISLNGTSLDTEALRAKLGPQTLAAIVVHLLGVPAKISEAASLAREQGAFIVEDAAQALGNETVVNGRRRKLGTIGDVGVFSFGRGKPLSLGAGGALVTNSEEIAQAAKAQIASLQTAGSGCDLVRSLLYAAFFRPALYWIPRGLPFLQLGETIFTLDIKVEAMSRFTASLGAMTLSRFEDIRLGRARRAQRLLDRLADGHSIHPLGRLKQDNGYLRLPLLVANGGRPSLVARLARLGATGMYPVPLSEQPGTAPYLGDQARESYPNARRLSERLLTLPLHGYLSEGDVAEIERALHGMSLAPVTETT